MAFTPRTFTSATVTARDDGSLYQFFMRNQDGIINIPQGTMTLSSNTISIGQSNWVVGGRMLYSNGETIALSPTITNGYGRVIISITNANSVSPTISFIQEYQADPANFRALTQGTINRYQSQTTYEAELARFTVTASNCSDLVPYVQEGLWGAMSSVARLTYEGSMTANYWQQNLPLQTQEWLTHGKTSWLTGVGNYQFTLTRGAYRIDILANLPANASAVYGVGLGRSNTLIANFPAQMQPAFTGAVNRISTSGILIVDSSGNYNPVMHSNVAVSGTASMITTIEKLW